MLEAEKFYFVRHGQTDANSLLKYIWQPRRRLGLGLCR